MTVDTRLDDLEQFQTRTNRRLKGLEDADTLMLSRLDQVAAQAQQATAAALANAQAISQLQQTTAVVIQHCLDIETALGVLRARARQAFHGEGNGV